MTHFLARLVDRARGTAPRVEPIIAPRFAPADSLGIELLPEITTEVESPVASPPAELKPVRQREVTRPIEEGAPSKSAVDAPDAEEAKIEIVAETLLVPQVHEQPQSLVVRPTDRQRNALEDSRAATLAQQRVAKPKSPRAKLKRSAPRPLQPVHDDLRFPNEPREQAPVVRVTIGRIEVRAAPAPATPPRKPARPAGPTLTLEAYLKARKEGAR